MMRIVTSVPHRGFYVLRGLHTPADIDLLVEQVRMLKSTHPFASPKMLDGSQLSVRVSSWGNWGWWVDERGFRYVPRHPKHGQPWPEFPDGWLRFPLAYLYIAAWDASQRLPGWKPADWEMPLGPASWCETIDTALVNYYASDATLGWHVDKTEVDTRSPILTMSVGAAARFEIKLDGEVHRVTLRSGDGCVMAGASRNAEHRIVKLMTPADLAAEQQADLFAGSPPADDIYNPITSGARLSITWRRTGLTRTT